MKNLMQQAMEARQRKYKAYREAAELLRAVSLLPDELKLYGRENVEVSADRWGGKVRVYFALQGDTKNKAKAVTEIKDYLGKSLGFAFERVVHLWAESFSYEGEMEIAGLKEKLCISLRYAPQPPGCKLIKTTHMEEVARYEAFCEGTGEQI